MEFTIRDMIYIGAYISTVTGLFVGFRTRIRQTEEKQEAISNVIYLPRGGLNVVTTEICKSHRDDIHGSIRREAGVTREAFDQVHCLNQNIIKIMMHLKLEPIIIERRQEGREDE